MIIQIRDLFGKKKEKIETETVKVKFDELNDWLKNKANSFDRFNADAESILVEIQGIINTLKTDIEELEKLELSDKIPAKMMQSARAASARFIKRMHILIGLQVPAKAEIKEVKKFYDSSLQIIGDVNERALPYYRYAKVLFRKQSESIPKNLKMLGILFNSLKNLLDTHEPKFSKFESALNSVSVLQDNIERLRQYEEDINNISKKIRDLRQNIQNIETDIERFTKNPEWQKLNMIITSNEKLRLELENVKSDILQNISPLQKSFKKFNKYINSEKETFEERKMIETYINYPILAIEKDVELNTLRLILRQVSHAAENDKLELKDEKKRKTLAQIETIMETDDLKDLAKRYNEIRRSIKQNNEEISKNEIKKQKNSLTNKLNELNSQLKEMENNLQEMERTRANLTSQIKDDKSKLEEQLEQASDSKVSIIDL